MDDPAPEQLHLVAQRYTYTYRHTYSRYISELSMLSSKYITNAT